MAGRPVAESSASIAGASRAAAHRRSHSKRDAAASASARRACGRTDSHAAVAAAAASAAAAAAVDNLPGAELARPQLSISKATHAGPGSCRRRGARGGETGADSSCVPGGSRRWRRASVPSRSITALRTVCAQLNGSGSVLECEPCGRNYLDLVMDDNVLSFWGVTGQRKADLAEGAGLELDHSRSKSMSPSPSKSPPSPVWLQTRT